MKELSRLTGYEYYYYTVAINIGGDEATYGQKGEYGTGILSKYPIKSGEDYKLNSQGYEQRMLGHAEIEVGGKTLHFFNTHLSWETDSVRAAQFKQVDEITGEYDYVILTGDFNQRSLSEGEGFSYLYPTNCEDNPLETYKGTDWNTLCIDNILYTQDFKLLDSKVVDNNHSDHCLLVAEFELKLK
jgi:endonuclease/exonuclease/phosphatase family metal-dependent hydrolase